MTTYEGNFDDSHDPLMEERTRITDADMNVVWEGSSRDFNEMLRNRWARFTDDEMEMLASERQSTDRAFEAEIEAEFARRCEKRSDPA